MLNKEQIKKFFNRVERVLLRLSIALAILLVLSQVMLQIPAVRMIITSVDLLEGHPYHR